MEQTISLSPLEQEERKRIASETRAMVKTALPVEDQDESSLMLVYDGYYLQISFSALHPLMVIYLARHYDGQVTPKMLRTINQVNQRNVLGSHAINSELHCYSFHACQWLNGTLTTTRFFEILNRCLDEAKRGYHAIIGTK